MFFQPCAYLIVLEKIQLYLEGVSGNSVEGFFRESELSESVILSSSAKRTSHRHEPMSRPSVAGSASHEAGDRQIISSFACSVVSCQYSIAIDRCDAPCESLVSLWLRCS